MPAKRKPVVLDHLRHEILIHCCKDRTLTYRTRGEPVFNGVALPVFSVPTKSEAERLIAMVGCVQYSEHPLLPGQKWRKIDVDFKQVLELDDLPRVTEKLRSVYERIKR